MIKTEKCVVCRVTKIRRMLSGMGARMMFPSQRGQCCVRRFEEEFPSVELRSIDASQGCAVSRAGAQSIVITAVT